jgi:hypothetical protein
MEVYERIASAIAAHGRRSQLLEPALRRILRARVGLTQTDVADTLGVCPPRVSRWESGATPRGSALDRAQPGRCLNGLHDVRTWCEHEPDHARPRAGHCRRQILSVCGAFVVARTRACPRFPPRPQDGKGGGRRFESVRGLSEQENPRKSGMFVVQDSTAERSPAPSDRDRARGAASRKAVQIDLFTGHHGVPPQIGGTRHGRPGSSLESPCNQDIRDLASGPANLGDRFWGQVGPSRGAGRSRVRRAGRPGSGLSR